MPSPRDPALRLSLRDVRKHFGRRPVLDGIDLDVPAASITLLTGRNGSGKTTLLRCLAGLARYDGEVWLDGELCRPAPHVRRGIGYLPQAVGLPGWATVDEVLDLFGRLQGSTETAVALPPGFLPPRDQRADELSGGQRQRVALAVALLGRPRLLLLDEPTANLDDDARGDVVTLLEEARAGGTSVLIAAPSPADLSDLPDRTIRLVDGSISAQKGPGLHVVGPAAGDPASGEVAR